MITEENNLDPAKTDDPDDSQPVIATGTPETSSAAGSTPESAPRTVPEPARQQLTPPAGEESKPDPTRFGDWEKNGRCIDF